MKKVSIISVLLSISGFAGNPISENAVPRNITQKFHDQFPNIHNVEWQQTDNNAYEAIILDNNEIDIFYDTKARCMEVDRKISFEQLPNEIKYQIKKEYGLDFHIVMVKIVDKKNEKPIYSIRIKQGKLTYDIEYLDTNRIDWAFHKKIIN